MVADSHSVRELIKEAVDERNLDYEGDLDFLIGCIGEALENQDEFEDDYEVSQWVITQWCQEVGYSPDLREFDTGEGVPFDSIPQDRETAALREAMNGD